MTPTQLLVARVFLSVGAILGLIGIGGCCVLVVAYVHDRVRRLGWRGFVRHLCRSHPVDELLRQERHRQPASHSLFTRHRRTLQ